MTAQPYATDTRKIAATGVSKEEDFGSLCDGLLISADGDCFIDFDRPADTGSQFVKGNTATQYWPAVFTKITAITSGGSVNVYITGLRGSKK